MVKTMKRLKGGFCLLSPTAHVHADSESLSHLLDYNDTFECRGVVSERCWEPSLPVQTLAVALQGTGANGHAVKVGDGQ